jgi:hypothetical protein
MRQLRPAAGLPADLTAGGYAPDAGRVLFGT